MLDLANFLNLISFAKIHNEFLQIRITSFSKCVAIKRIIEKLDCLTPLATECKVRLFVAYLTVKYFIGERVTADCK